MTGRRALPAEEIFDFFENPAIFRWVLPFRCRKLLEQLSLLVRESCGDSHADVNVMVASARTLQKLHALATKAKHLIWLCPRRNAQRLRPVDRLGLNLCAEGRLCERDRLLGMDVVIAARELRMFGDGDENVQIARRSAVVTRLPFARHAQAGAFIDTRRNLDGELLLLASPAGAAASRAGIFDDLSRASALRTGSRDREKSL